MKKRISILIAAAILAGGCTRIEQDDVSLYAASAASLTEQVDLLIGEYQDTIKDRELVMLAAEVSGHTDEPLTSQDLSNITPLPRLYPVKQASEVLHAYSEALLALSSTDNPEQAELAALNLGGTLERFSRARGQAAGSNEGYYALAAQITRALTEAQKQQAIKQTVLAANPMVEEVCDGLSQAITDANLAGALAGSRAYILAEEIRDFNQRVEIRAIPLAKSRREVERLYGLWQESATTELLVEETLEALAVVKQNHQLLAMQVSQDSFASDPLKQAIGEMQAMKRRFTDVEQLLQSCEGEIVREESQLVCKG